MRRVGRGRGRGRLHPPTVSGVADSGLGTSGATSSRQPTQPEEPQPEQFADVQSTTGPGYIKTFTLQFCLQNVIITNYSLAIFKLNFDRK